MKILRNPKIVYILVGFFYYFMTYFPTMQTYLKGRGAQINPNNPFNKEVRANDPLLKFGKYEELEALKTRFIGTKAKTIINKVISPDVGLEYSLNPYQGCEHGCVYCYARKTHNYWGYSSGTDFESTILIKENAAELLEKKLQSKNWEARPIMLSGNTDCYQPIEKKTEITRKLLEIFLKYKHPVGITTKNQLILRDLDLLKKLNAENLVSVAISINTLDDGLRRKLEPRASSIPVRLRLLQLLAAEGIPVTVLAAPIIPGLNDHSIFKLVKKVSELGARSIQPIVLRLNGDNKEIFSDWLNKNYPDRAQKVINQICSLHKGQLGSSEFGERMKGSGKIAEMIHQQFKLAKKLYLMNRKPFEYNTQLFGQMKRPQMSLFSI